MALKTLSELRSNIGSTTRETQVNDLIDTFLNLTMSEIWNFHPWTFARRKTTFATVASQEDYSLDEEVDRVALLRQTSSPQKLLFVPDNMFYRIIPNPEDIGTGPPRFYRLWEETGIQTNTSQDETITVESSSTADTSTFKVVIVGRESTNGLVVTETISLNGTTPVTSANTYDAGGLFQISKSAATTGIITVKGSTSGTTLSFIAPEEIAPRYKRISLYPIPSSVITMRLEYYERLRLLVSDNDVPQMDHKWNWVLREGALAKMWEYKQNEQAFLAHQANFEKGLVMMRKQDHANLDFIPVLGRRIAPRTSVVTRFNDSVNDAFPSYAVSAY